MLIRLTILSTKSDANVCLLVTCVFPIFRKPRTAFRKRWSPKQYRTGFTTQFNQLDLVFYLIVVYISSIFSLQSRHFLTKSRRYIDRGRHLEKQRKRLRGRGGGRGEGRGGERSMFSSPPLPLPYFKPIYLSLKNTF